MPPTQLADPPGLDYAQQLRQSVSRLARRLRVSGDGGLTPSQLSTLSSVVRHGPMRVGELSAREGVNPTTLSRIVGRLEELGCVSRSPDPADRRGAVLSPTASGRRTLARVEEERTVLLRSRLAELDPAHRALIEAALPALAALVDALPVPGAAR